MTLERQTERGGVLTPDERLTREQAIRLYTINNAYLHHEEKEKGSLEVGQARRPDRHRPRRSDVPGRDVRNVKVLPTVVGGKVVYERKE